MLVTRLIWGWVSSRGAHCWEHCCCCEGAQIVPFCKMISEESQLLMLVVRGNKGPKEMLFLPQDGGSLPVPPLLPVCPCAILSPQVWAGSSDFLHWTERRKNDKMLFLKFGYKKVVASVRLPFSPFLAFWYWGKPAAILSCSLKRPMGQGTKISSQQRARMWGP